MNMKFAQAYARGLVGLKVITCRLAEQDGDAVWYI
jgi:hypothetical protein